MKIIGICGDIGSGKDTVANHLHEKYGFEIYSFANRLKEWTLSLVEPLGVERRHIFGGSDETKQADQAEPLQMLRMREHIVEWKGNLPVYERYHWTGRGLLEELGTEVARSIHPDIWVRHLTKIFEDRNHAARGGYLSELRFVVPDVRFPNEFEALQNMGGEIWRTRLLVDHGVAGHCQPPEEDTPCPASEDWVRACTCGAIRSTGHESDEAWRYHKADRVLSAEKPGVDKLKFITDLNMGELSNE